MDYRNSPVIRHLQTYAESLSNLAKKAPEEMSYDSEEGSFYVPSMFGSLTNLTSSIFQTQKRECDKVQENIEDFKFKIHAVSDEIKGSKLNHAGWMELIDTIAKVKKAINALKQNDSSSLEDLKKELASLEQFILETGITYSNSFSWASTKSADESYHLFTQPTIDDLEVDGFVLMFGDKKKEVEKEKEVKTEGKNIDTPKLPVVDTPKFTVHPTPLRELEQNSEKPQDMENSSNWTIRYDDFKIQQNQGIISVIDINHPNRNHGNWGISNNFLYVVTKSSQKENTQSIMIVDLSTLQIRSFDLEMGKNPLPLQNRINAITIKNEKLYVFADSERLCIIDLSSIQPRLIEERTLPFINTDRGNDGGNFRIHGTYRIFCEGNKYILYSFFPPEPLPETIERYNKKYPNRDRDAAEPHSQCRFIVFSESFERISAWEPNLGEDVVFTKDYVVSYSRNRAYSIYSLQGTSLKTISYSKQINLLKSVTNDNKVLITFRDDAKTSIEVDLDEELKS